MEFHYDGARENVNRLPKLLAAVAGSVATLLAAYILLYNVRLMGGRSGAVVLIMLLSGPVLISVYLSHLLRHHQYRSARIVLEQDAIVIYVGGQERRVERKEVDYVHHSGNMLEIRLRNQDPILLPAQFTDQDELLRKLGC